MNGVASFNGRRAKSTKSQRTLSPFTDDQQSITRTSLDQEQILSGQFWGELRVFLAVAKGKSFSRAAEILNTSQPTVGRQVKRLQDLMGSQLFFPTQQGVRLTPKGQELATALSRLDHALFSLTNDLRAEKQQTEGVVRVSVTDGLNTFFVAPALRKFSAQYPRIQCHLKTPQNVLSLRENQTDLMVGFVPVEAADITSKRLAACISYRWRASVTSVSRVCRRGAIWNGICFFSRKCTRPATGLWNEWKHIVAAGQMAHYCDNSFAYGMLVKAGIGIGLLGSYAVLEPASVPLEMMEPVPCRSMRWRSPTGSIPARCARRLNGFAGFSAATIPGSTKNSSSTIGPTEYDAGFKALVNL